MPPHASTGPIVLPPSVPPPDKPEQGPPPIPIGGTGWTLQWIRGFGWCLIPPDKPEAAPKDANPVPVTLKK